MAILPLPCWWIFPVCGSPYRHHAHQRDWLLVGCITIMVMMQ
ncbi:hypothetical protein P4G36_20350 [Escherichia coli]|nr:hypothetical protein [Escherichia coli]EDU66579.1 hypothetical protein Ec53638_4061 [Escherichia coli 53638]EFZ57507.1 hypothetical protein ECLT68_3504 [Escherichia coli LT-68]MDS1459842.1 hypothetical protein [Escherichia coli]